MSPAGCAGADVLAERLRARPAWRGWDEHRIAEHQRFAASLRSRIEPTFDTGSVEEVADQVARWVTDHLCQAVEAVLP